MREPCRAERVVHCTKTLYKFYTSNKKNPVYYVLAVLVPEGDG